MIGTLATLVLLAAMPAPAVTLTVFSDRHNEGDQAVYARFTAETGIRVALVDEEEATLLDRLDHPGGEVSPDLVVLAGAAALEALAEHGRLAPAADDAGLRAVPEPLRDPAGRWAALGWWARAVAFRGDRFAAADLARYEDLADGRFAGQVLVRSASSPYNRALAAAMIAADGVEDAETWARGVAAGFARPPQGGDTDQLRALGDGTGGVAIVNTRYWARFAASDKVTERAVLDGLDLAFPNQPDRGTAIDITGAAILAAAPHGRAAQLLMDYLLRADVQTALAQDLLDFPARHDARIPAPLAALGPFKADLGAVRQLFRLDADAARVLDKAGWE